MRNLWVVVLLGILMAPGCGSSGSGSGSGSSSGSGGAACVPGQSSQCWCANGGMGAQVCLSDFTYAPCSCSDGVPGDVVQPEDTGIADTETTDTGSPGTTGGDTSLPPPQDTGGEPTPDTSLPPPDTNPGVDQCTDPIFLSMGSHVHSVTLPLISSEYLCDANGDGVMNEKDGNFNTVAKTVMTSGVDMAGFMEQAFLVSEHILLLEYEGYLGGTQSNFKVNLLRGSKLASQPQSFCDEAAGELCQWSVDSQSIDAQTCARQSVFPDASVVGGALSAGAGWFQLPIVVGPGAWIEASLQTGRITGLTSGAVQVTQGRLCGTFDRQAFLSALTDVCALDSTQPVCGNVAALMPSLLNCQGDVCTITLAFAASPVLGFTLGP